MIRHADKLPDYPLDPRVQGPRGRIRERLSRLGFYHAMIDQILELPEIKKGCELISEIEEGE